MNIHKAKVLEELKREKISIINLLDRIILHAEHVKASDIHIHPTQKDLQIRFRIDGDLKDIYQFPKYIHEDIISRIKILTELRTDEHQIPQDGRFRLHLEDENFLDIRVSIVPAYDGEHAVLRLLSQNKLEQSLEALGFAKYNREKIEKALMSPHGMILSTGPTGSGKTTTLYSLLEILNKRELSLITIEDPIEYSIEGIKQIQVNHRTGLTFGNGLRSILRQDPDIIMVGEIRDKETAEIAVNTALTGHLLLSTLHTNDAASLLPRFIDMGIDAYLIASTVRIAIGQRLIRKICPHCKVEKKLSDIEQLYFSEIISDSIFENPKFYEGEGCEMCEHSGYLGRIIISEVLVMDSDIKDAILRHASSDEIREIAIDNGMIPILADGFEKALSGIIPLSEIIRVVYE